MGEEKIKEILAGKFDLDIPNFEKWNPGQKTKEWLKLSLHWFDDPKFHDLPSGAVLLWVLLLTLRGRSKGPLRGLSTTYLQPRLPLRGTSVGPLILRLAEKQLISLRIEENRIEEKRVEADSDAIKEPFSLLTPQARKIYQERLGADYEKEVMNAHLHWQSKPEPRPPFVNTLNNWCEKLPPKKKYEDFLKEVPSDRN